MMRWFVSLAVLLLSLAPAAQAQRSKADAYFGYSRVGANLYAPGTPGMNGLQFALHLRTTRFVGVEGDLSHYGASVGAGSQHVTLIMFGPRVTVDAVGLSVFAHALGGFAHYSTNAVPLFPTSSHSAASYAFGAGCDLPLLRGLKLRLTGDYLGDDREPSSQYSPSHYRVGAGVAYHF